MSVFGSRVIDMVRSVRYFPVYGRTLSSRKQVDCRVGSVVQLPLGDTFSSVCCPARTTYFLLSVCVPLYHRSLVIYGVAHLFLNMACGVLCVFIGVDSDLDTALAATVFCSHVQNLLSIGEG